jgi:hypothetical protein
MLNVHSEVFTCPAVNGTDTVIALPANFDPKLMFLVTAGLTADSLAHGNAVLAHGAATFDGAGGFQQGYAAAFALDAADPTNTAFGLNTTACLKTFGAVTPSVNAEARIASYDIDTITLDWFVAPPTGYRVAVLVLGGDDIDAYLHSFTLATGAGEQDVALPGGWGRPHTVIVIGSKPALGDSNMSTGMSFGAAKSPTERAATVAVDADAQASAAAFLWQKARLLLGLSSTGTADTEVDLHDLANYPTDGYALNKVDAPTAAAVVIAIGIKGGVQVKIGASSAPTTIGNQDIDAGFVPKAALTWGGNVVSSLTVGSTDARLIAFGLGFLDGTNEFQGQYVSNDAAVAMWAGRVWSEGKVRSVIPGANATATPVLDGLATVTFVGNLVRANWTDAPAVAVESCYLVFGDAIPSGQDIATAQVVETDIAQPLTRSKVKTLGEVVGSEIAQPLTRVKSRALGQVVGSEVAQPVSLGAGQTVAVAQVVETEIAQQLSRLKTVSLGRVTETEIAQPLVRRKLRTLLQKVETEIAQPFTRRKAKVVLQKVETDIAQPIARRKAKLLGQTVEADTAQEIVGGPSIIPVGQVVSTETARPLTRSKIKSVGQSVETSLAQAFGRLKARALGQATETDIATPVILSVVKLPLVLASWGLRYASSVNGGLRLLRVNAGLRIVQVSAGLRHLSARAGLRRGSANVEED